MTTGHTRGSNADTADQELGNTGWCPDSSLEGEAEISPVSADEDHRFLDKQEVCFLLLSILLKKIIGKLA